MSGTAVNHADDESEEWSDTDRRDLLERVAQLDCETAANAERMLQSLDDDAESEGESSS